MRKKILGFVFAAAVLAAMAVPLFGSVGSASADRSASCTAVTTVHDKLHPDIPGHQAMHGVRDAACQ